MRLIGRVERDEPSPGDPALVSGFKRYGSRGRRVASAIHSGPAGHAALGVASQRPQCGRHREHNPRPRPTAFAAERPQTKHGRLDYQDRVLATGAIWSWTLTSAGQDQIIIAEDTMQSRIARILIPSLAS